MKKILIFLFGMILFSSSASFAQQSNTASKEIYAIVVGISNYHYIKPLSYADRDADLFSELLRSGAGGRIKPENLFLMKNDSANAGNFWSALLRINNKKLNKGDRVYIYFAGHGDAIKGLNEYYLLLSDCQPANDGNNYLLSLGAIDMYHLKNRIGILTAQGVEVILILDACRTNELAGGYASQAFNSSIIQTKVGEIAMLATGPGQVSIEDASLGSGHGLFTYNLIDALSGRADKEEEGNKDQITSLEEIHYWVSKNVKLMSEKFKVTQSPVFSYDGKNNMPIGIVDSGFSVAWNQLKQLKNINNSLATPPVKTQRGNDLEPDSVLFSLYNKFNIARKENRLWGDNSADYYYDQMDASFRNERITEDARYALASDFINFAQQKINLYLEGKDLLSMESLKEKVDSANMPGFLSDEYERLQRTVSEKWTIAARMIQKAGKLLSAKNDSSLFYQLKPKISFLLARGYISRERETELSFDGALHYAQDAFKSDSNAAYTAECLGLLYAYRNSFARRYGSESEYEMGTMVRLSDTAMNYFKKAIRLAPKWVSPYRSIGLKIYGEHWFDSAFVYLQKALYLNPEDGSTYVMIGDIYKQQRPDSAIYYYKKALTFSGKSSHPMIYRKMARVFIYGGYNMNSPSFKSDSIMAYSMLALTADQANANDPSKTAEVFKDVYMDIAHAYSLKKKNDSAVLYFFKVVGLFPNHEWANRGIIGYYVGRNLKDSVLYYSQRFLQASPENAFALLQIAQYYDNRIGYIDSAILYYERNLKATREKDLPREKLGYIIMTKDKNDTRPLEYFSQTIKELPFAWRSYFNIACYYANRGDVEKSVEFLEKALLKGMRNKKQIDSEKYFEAIRETEQFKKLIAKYFPG